jgi:hypothetical protein
MYPALELFKFLPAIISTFLALRLFHITYFRFLSAISTSELLQRCPLTIRFIPPSLLHRPTSPLKPLSLLKLPPPPLSLLSPLRLPPPLCSLPSLLRLPPPPCSLPSLLRLPRQQLYHNSHRMSSHRWFGPCGPSSSSSSSASNSLTQL